MRGRDANGNFNACPVVLMSEDLSSKLCQDCSNELSIVYRQTETGFIVEVRGLRFCPNSICPGSARALDGRDFRAAKNLVYRWEYVEKGNCLRTFVAEARDRKNAIINERDGPAPKYILRPKTCCLAP